MVDALPISLPRQKAPPGGPVYQGVSKQIRALFPSDDPDARARKDELAGWVSLALSHARAIDNDQRASVGRAQVSTELREALTYIAEALNAGDSFDAFLEELRSGSAVATPHPPL